MLATTPGRCLIELWDNRRLHKLTLIPTGLRLPGPGFELEWVPNETGCALVVAHCQRPLRVTGIVAHVGSLPKPITAEPWLNSDAPIGLASIKNLITVKPQQWPAWLQVPSREWVFDAEAWTGRTGLEWDPGSRELVLHKRFAPRVRMAQGTVMVELVQTANPWQHVRHDALRPVPRAMRLWRSLQPLEKWAKALATDVDAALALKLPLEAWVLDARLHWHDLLTPSLHPNLATHDALAELGRILGERGLTMGVSVDAARLPLNAESQHLAVADDRGRPLKQAGQGLPDWSKPAVFDAWADALASLCRAADLRLLRWHSLHPWWDAQNGVGAAPNLARLRQQAPNTAWMWRTAPRSLSAAWADAEQVAPSLSVEAQAAHSQARGQLQRLLHLPPRLPGQPLRLAGGFTWVQGKSVALRPEEQYSLMLANLLADAQLLGDPWQHLSAEALQTLQAIFPLPRLQIESFAEINNIQCAEIQGNGLKYLLGVNRTREAQTFTLPQRKGIWYDGLANSWHLPGHTCTVAAQDSLLLLWVPPGQAMLAGSTGHVWPGQEVAHWQPDALSNLQVYLHAHAMAQTQLYAQVEAETEGLQVNRLYQRAHNLGPIRAVVVDGRNCPRETQVQTA